MVSSTCLVGVGASVAPVEWSTREFPMVLTPRLVGLIALAFLMTLRAPSMPLFAQQQVAPPQQRPEQQGGPPQNQPQGQQPRPPTFRAGVNFVRVDVIVSDRNGKPVPDLAEADFEVTEDGQPQKIETFKLVKVDGIPKPGDPDPRQIRSEYDEEAEAAREDERVFALLLADYHGRSMSA